MRIKLYAALIGLAVLAFWQAASEWQWISPILLPAPLDIGRFLVDATRDGLLPYALMITLSRLLIGYAMGLLLGIGLGLLLNVSALARATLGVLALGLQTLPSICWAPLSLLWFGQTEQAMYFVVIMGSTWAVALAVDNALKSVPRQYVQAARVMGSKGAHTWLTVMLPAALPSLVSGAKLGWAFSWRSLMAAEIYVTIITRPGLGQLLHFGRELNAMDQAMGVMVAIVLTGFFTDKILFKPLERRLNQSWGRTNTL